ncbi:hypothetical protein [Frankia sp. ACN1ag]|uniref:hypothetical protein n=1 Tax=Frankia sp. ACN1ag TaxID=102891 RepID=UPI0006DCA823|nr:hypothetical protein [Frankia sp. ACN1ag]KQC37900.1 hypothetical protein UK82_12950 [Frankia sp. ACN1ag]
MPLQYPHTDTAVLTTDLDGSEILVRADTDPTPRIVLRLNARSTGQVAVSHLTAYEALQLAGALQNLAGRIHLASLHVELAPRAREVAPDPDEETPPD